MAQFINPGSGDACFITPGLVANPPQEYLDNLSAEFVDNSNPNAVKRYKSFGAGLAELVMGGEAPNSTTFPVVFNNNALPLPSVGILTGSLVRIGAADGVAARIIFDTFGAAAALTFRRANGTNAAKTPLLANDIIGGFSFDGLMTAPSTYSAVPCFVFAQALENWNSGARGCSFVVSTTPALSLSRANSLIVNNISTTAGVNNIASLGSASIRWTEVFATNGTINTSDARSKNAVQRLNGAEIAASMALAEEFGTYQLLDAIEKKGENARFHIGMTVQRAMEIMKNCGLNPFRYGFICYDEWEDSSYTDTEGVFHSQPAGSAYGFRMDELMAFIARGVHERIARLEAKLESKRI